MNNDGFDLPSGLWRSSWRPPTQEKTETNITTQVVILLLQGIVLMALLGVGMALTFAAQQAWGVEDSLPVLFIGCGTALYITLHWLAKQLVDYETGGAVALLAIALLALMAVAWGAWQVVQQSAGLDVAVMRVLVCGLLIVLGFVFGVAMTVQADLRAGMVFMWILWAGALTFYLLMPRLAERSIWPWMLTGAAVAFNYGAYFTGQAFKKEIADPFSRGAPPSEQYKADYVRFLIEQAQAERIPQELTPIEVTIIEEGGGRRMLLPGLSGTDGEKRVFATDAVQDCLALDKTLPRTHPLWQEAHDRGLVEWRDSDDRNKGQKATLIGKHVFERLLEEL